MRVSVAFYRGGDNSAKEPVLNTMAKLFTGDYVHCEMVFDNPTSGVHNLACSVWQHETVFMKPKTFGRTNWTHITLNLSDLAGRTMKTFCREQIGKPFNTCGFYRCITPFPRSTDGQSWFCSELAITAFQRAGFFPRAIAATCTPTSLFHMLQGDGFDSHVAGNPLVDNRIKTGGLSRRAAMQTNLSLIRQWSEHVEDKV